LVEEGTKTEWVITGEAILQNHKYGRKDEGVVNKTRFCHINGNLSAEVHKRKFVLIHCNAEIHP
jgi:hypothetical protein